LIFKIWKQFGYLKQMENDSKPWAQCWAGNGPRPQCWGAATYPARQPKAERRPSRSVDAARLTHQLVTAHGTRTVARPPPSSRATWCGGTDRGRSSVKGGKYRARWYRRGHTKVAARQRGGRGGAGHQRSGASGELWWSAEVVVGA
jgi:hypothetical protein